LGSGVDTTTKGLLETLANVKSPLYGGTYTAGQPDGLFFYIPDCSAHVTDCNNSINQVFQTIAAKVLLRLTQ